MPTGGKHGERFGFDEIMNRYQLRFDDWRATASAETLHPMCIGPERDWSDEGVLRDSPGQTGAEAWTRKTRLESAAGATVLGLVPGAMEAANSAVQGEVKVLGSLLPQKAASGKPPPRSASLIFQTEGRGGFRET